MSEEEEAAAMFHERILHARSERRKAYDALDEARAVAWGWDRKVGALYVEQARGSAPKRGDVFRQKFWRNGPPLVCLGLAWESGSVMIKVARLKKDRTPSRAPCANVMHGTPIVMLDEKIPAELLAGFGEDS